MAGKTHFAALPPRAISDTRLTLLDLRTLMVIAYHDRFNVNKMGCYIGHDKMAKIIKAHEKSVTRSIGRLRDMGYLKHEIHEKNKRVRVYFVIYDEEAIGNATVTLSDEIGNPVVTQKPAIGNPDFGNIENYQSDADLKILPEGYKIYDEAENISDEIAHFPDKPRNQGGIESPIAYLSIMERMGKKHGLPAKQVEALLSVAEDTVDHFDNGTPEYGLATRLIDIYGHYELTECGDERAL